MFHALTPSSRAYLVDRVRAATMARSLARSVTHDI